MKQGIDERPSRQRRAASVIAVSLAAVAIGLVLIIVAVIGLGPRESGIDRTTPTTAISADSNGTPLTGMPTSSTGSALGPVAPTIRRSSDLEIGRSYGRQDAPATLTVWGDFQCPFCAKFARQTEPRLIADYVNSGALRIAYRDWVFIGVESVSAAVAARCADRQGQFWPYHDYLLWNQMGENQGGFSDSRLDAIAGAAGLDVEAFRLCTLDLDLIQAVKDETAAGDQAGIGMTPTLVVDGTVMPGAATSETDYAHLRQIIDASIAAPELDHSQTAPSPS